MPIQLVGNASSLYDASAHRNISSPASLHIGLINNMPDGALQATERQFLTLLDSAADDVVVRPSLYAFPDVLRGEIGLRHVSRYYSGIETLWNEHLDGLIVTGAEPRAPDLKDEPYWVDLTKVLEWAEHNTHSVICSCLAAHAAVLHCDGIGRRRLAEKHFGVFECGRTSEHPLTVDVPSTFQVPHSRWNDIPDNQLTDCGYRVLTRAKDGIVDVFVKQRKSLFVFFQGHPEYEANTLLLEYRRDVISYLRRERDTYPSMPQGYFDRDTTDALTTLRERALSGRSEELLGEFPTALVEKSVANTWHPMATEVYGNWLAYLCAQKQRRLRDRQRWNPSRRQSRVNGGFAD